MWDLISFWPKKFIALWKIQNLIQLNFGSCVFFLFFFFFSQLLFSFFFFYFISMVFFLNYLVYLFSSYFQDAMKELKIHLVLATANEEYLSFQGNILDHHHLNNSNQTKEHGETIFFLFLLYIWWQKNFD